MDADWDEIVRITLPPLRDRVEDIPILANHFLAQFWNRYHSSRDARPHLSSSALEFLMSRPWRGNVRELQNVIEHLVVLAEPDSEISLDSLPMDEEWARGSGQGDSVTECREVGVAQWNGKACVTVQRCVQNSPLPPRRGR